MAERTFWNVKKIFETGKTEEGCELEIETVVEGMFGGRRKTSFSISRRVWEEMGKTMGWKEKTK